MLNILQVYFCLSNLHMTPKSFKISAAATDREKCVLEMLALQFLTSRTLEAEIKIRFHQNILILSLENVP